MNTLTVILFILEFITLISVFILTIKTLISSIKQERKYKQWEEEYNAKKIKEHFDLISKKGRYEFSLRQIRTELNKNQNGSVENLSKRIKNMIPEDLI